MWRVKVCGLTRPNDAIGAAKAGADALGWVLERSSKRFVGEKPWYSVSSVGGVSSVAVMGELRDDLGDDVLRLFQVVQAFGLNTVQSKGYMPVYRPQCGCPLEDWLEETQGWKWCLLDPFHEEIQGGTGAKVDWELASAFVAAFDGRVILAGGLGPDNVGEAIRLVKPFGVDASSGLELSPGVKEMDLVNAYVDSAWDGLCDAHGKSMQELWDETSAIRNG